MSDTVMIETPQVADKRLYKSTMKFCNIILPDGTRVDFKGGIYITGDTNVISYLDRAIARNEYAGSIYIDPNARTVTAEQENPMIALRKKLFAEFMAEQAKNLNPANDMGTSTQGPLKAASTTDIAPVTIGGPSVASLMTAAAKLPQSAAN
jgi:hypothetical protein